MSKPIELDLDALVVAATDASNATRGEPWRFSDQFNLVTTSRPGILEGDREVAQTSVIDNDRGLAVGAYIAAAQPSSVLELVRRLRAAEALAASRIEQIPTAAKMVMVFNDLLQEHPELRDQFEEFSEAIKKRCTSGRWTLVAFFPAGTDIKSLDAAQMGMAGWVRAERGGQDAD